MAFINTKYHYLERYNSIKRYKRRIMVGDNLSSTNVFADFPDNYSPMEINMEPIYIVKTKGATSIEEDTSGRFGRSNPYIGSTSIVSPNNYIFYGSANSGTYNNKRVFLNSNKGAGVVTSVESTNESYRHLYIEDPKIRPLKTRDVLKVGTKLYFNIPDNINELYNQYKSNGRTITTRAGEAQNNRVGTEEINNIMNLEYYSTYKVYKISILDLDTKYIFEVDTESQNPKTNISSYEIIHQTAIGTYNDYDFWSQYIFVDETTLATSDSFRQVQPGDKVSDTYFIYDFNELKKDILEAPGMGSNVILAIEEDADIEMTKINNTFSLSFYYIGGMPQIFRASYDTDGQTIDITNDLFRLSDKITDATSGDVTITNETWKVVNDTTFTKYMKVLK